jgi:hypothetical protein
LNSLARGHLRLGLICALLLAFLVALPIVTWASSDEDLTKADWSVNAPHDLAHNPPSEEAVRSFLRSTVGSITNQVCNAQFADLKHNGTLSLVLGDDGGGTADCNYSEIFDKSAGKFENYSADAYIGTPGAEDINGDGRFEVIVYDTAATEYDGISDSSGRHPHCEACRTCEESWPVIYAWSGSGYTDVSTQYPKYYERELASVKKQIAAIYQAEAAAHRPAPVVQPRVQVPIAAEPGTFSHGGQFGGGFGASGAQQIGTMQQQQTLESAPAATSTPDDAEPPDENQLDCLKAEAAKIERFLGRSKDAGMDDAIRWANSNDSGEREFASSVLPQIGTAEALRYEQTLSRDSNPDVAESAKEEIKDWGKPESPSAFERSP